MINNITSYLDPNSGPKSVLFVLPYKAFGNLKVESLNKEVYNWLNSMKLYSYSVILLKRLSLSNLSNP